MKCKNCWLLRNKLSNLEEHNWGLKKKIDELNSITKTAVQKAIDKINKYCKKNNVSVITNLNGLIRKLK